MSALTPQQRRSLEEADRLGHALVTTIDGRVAIILPAQPDDDATAEYLSRIVRALEREGIA